MKDLDVLPPDLPAPVDDGACDHLPGATLPAVPLPGTSGAATDPSALPGTTVIYFHPMIGRPDGPPLPGWNDIPGARGCTPQSCAFRDHHAELGALGAAVYGVSVQPTADQREAAARLHLPFELLSDERLELARALELPTFEYGGRILIKRLTLIVRDGAIAKVFYPVFPPDRNAADLVAWLRDNGGD